MSEKDVNEKQWLSKRKVGWQPLIVFLLVSYLFSITTDPIPLLGVIKKYTGISESNTKLLFNLPLFFGLIILLVLDNKKLLRQFIIFYVCIDMIFLFLYVYELVNTISFFQGEKGSYALMLDVVTMWFINVVLFGLLYWILDTGGPFERNTDEGENREILFPQFTLNTKSSRMWKPDIVDYITLAFTTATAFGPTDTYFLSRRFKIIMIIQVITSLTIITVLATRAANIIR